MANESLKQWDLAYPGISLRDTRNSIIAEKLFDANKVWTFQDGTDGHKWREYKSLEACQSAWEDVPAFARGSIAITPECEYLSATRVGGALENAINMPFVDKITHIINPKDLSALVETKWSTCEGHVAEGGQNFASGAAFSKTHYDKAEQVPYATIAALYHSLLIAHDGYSRQVGDCVSKEFKLF